MRGVHTTPFTFVEESLSQSDCVTTDAGTDS